MLYIEGSILPLYCTDSFGHTFKISCHKYKPRTHDKCVQVAMALSSYLTFYDNCPSSLQNEIANAYRKLGNFCV